MDDTISVSRETLRAELTGLELRLVDRLSQALDSKADRAVLDQALERIKALELSRAERVHMPQDIAELSKRITPLERFRYAIPGAAVISAAGSVTSVLYLILHHH